MWQTRQFPLVLEGGRQFGVTLGVNDRLVATGGGPDEAPGWRWAGLYKKFPVARPPYFRVSRAWGLRGAMGATDRQLLAGYRQVTETRPGTNGFTWVSYSSASPSETTFHFQAAQNPSSHNTTQNQTRPTP